MVTWHPRFGCISGLTSYPKLSHSAQPPALQEQAPGSKLVFSFIFAVCWSCEALGINKPQPGFLQPAAQGENERFVFLFPPSRADWWLNQNRQAQRAVVTVDGQSGPPPLPGVS